MKKHHHGYICTQWRRTSLWTKRCTYCHKDGTTWMGWAVFIWAFGFLIFGYLLLLT